jgi:uncharacterized lipoprotein YddW (UPF0748 family)
LLRLSAAALLAALALAAPGRAQAPDALPELRGVWVHEVSLGNPQAVDQTIREVAEAGFNVAYVRTWFQGVTLYPSDVVEAAGGPRQHRTSVGRDPLQEAIDAGRRYGVEVGAWMEYGLVAHTGYASGLACDSPGPILEANPSWGMVHRNGYTAEPPSVQGGLCFYWMDPAHPEVVAFLADMAAEIAARYPDLALYEADRFRYPSLDWSYAEATVARYVAETGLRDPRTVPAGDPELANWRNWRRDQTTGLMREVYTAVKAANSSVVVSAAVVPPYMIETAQDKLQHWPTWAAEGIIDIVEPMLYLPDTPDFQNQLGLALGRMPAPPHPSARPRTLFAAGIEARDDPRYNVPFQIEEARRRGTDGVVLWCWDRCPLASWRPTLRQGVFAVPATLPFDDRIAGAREAGLDLVSDWRQESGGWDGFHHAVTGRGHGMWHLQVLRAGYYDVYAHWPAGEGRASDVTYYVDAEGTEATFVADQRAGEGWHFLGQVHLAAPGGVGVSLWAGSEGTTVLDAIRLVRSQPFRATEALAVGERTVQVRFNYPPDPASVAPERFTLAGATVTSASSSPEDPFVVVLSGSRGSRRARPTPSRWAPGRCPGAACGLRPGPLHLRPLRPGPDRGPRRRGLRPQRDLGDRGRGRGSRRGLPDLDGRGRREPRPLDRHPP